MEWNRKEPVFLTEKQKVHTYKIWKLAQIDTFEKLNMEALFKSFIQKDLWTCDY